MPKYIDADELIWAVDGNRFVTDSVKSYVRCTVRNIPAADVEPVRHGRWIPGNAAYSEYNEGRLVARYYDRWTCSVCNYVINDQHYSQISYKRCPECGAKMDAESPKEEDDA